MKKTLSLLPVCFFLLASTMICRQALSSTIETRNIQTIWNEQVPYLSFTVQDIVDSKMRRRFKSGLPQRIVTRVYAYKKGGGDPLALTALSCRVVYDLWEEVYHVQIETEEQSLSRMLKNSKAVERLCLHHRELRVGDSSIYAGYSGKSIYFAIIIEHNPLSSRTVQRIRRWLARSEAEGRLAQEAFFGSFVSVFVNRKIGSAERFVQYRSQSFRVP